MQEMLGMVFLSNGLLQALYKSQNSSCPMAVKSSLVVIVIVVTHTHETTFVGQTLHLGAPNAWPNVCSSSYRPRSRHERKSQVTIKVAKSQWPQQRSASVHSLLTPDSEIYQEGTRQWGYLTTIVPVLRRVGVFSWNWKAFSFLSFPPCCSWSCKCGFGWGPSGILVFGFPGLTPLMSQTVSFRYWLLTLSLAEAHSQQWKKKSRQASNGKRIRPLSPLRSLGEWLGTAFQLSVLPAS